MRALLAGAAFVALLVFLAFVRSAYDDGPTPEERRCEQLRAAADAVADREDTVDDEVEYLRRARIAEKACGRSGG